MEAKLLTNFSNFLTFFFRCTSNISHKCWLTDIFLFNVGGLIYKERTTSRNNSLSRKINP